MFHAELALIGLISLSDLHLKGLKKNRYFNYLSLHSQKEIRENLVQSLLSGSLIHARGILVRYDCEAIRFCIQKLLLIIFNLMHE